MDWYYLLQILLFFLFNLGFIWMADKLMEKPE